MSSSKAVVDSLQGEVVDALTNDSGASDSGIQDPPEDGAQGDDQSSPYNLQWEEGPQIDRIPDEEAEEDVSDDLDVAGDGMEN